MSSQAVKGGSVMQEYMAFLVDARKDARQAAENAGTSAVLEQMGANIAREQALHDEKVQKTFNSAVEIAGLVVQAAGPAMSAGQALNGPKNMGQALEGQPEKLKQLAGAAEKYEAQLDDIQRRLDAGQLDRRGAKLERQTAQGELGGVELIDRKNKLVSDVHAGDLMQDRQVRRAMKDGEGTLDAMLESRVPAPQVKPLLPEPLRRLKLGDKTQEQVNQYLSEMQQKDREAQQKHEAASSRALSQHATSSGAVRDLCQDLRDVIAGMNAEKPHRDRRGSGR